MLLKVKCKISSTEQKYIHFLPHNKMLVKDVIPMGLWL